MTQNTVTKNHVIDLFDAVQACNLEDVIHQCADLTWNQVFLAIDPPLIS